jgi:hypothetical protein
MVDLQVLPAGNELVFVLDQPARLLSLEVFSSLGETVWKILPTTLTALPVLRMNNAFVQLPHADATAVREALRGAASAVRGAQALGLKAATSSAQPLDDLAKAIAQDPKVPEKTMTIVLKALGELKESLRTSGRSRTKPALAENKSRLTIARQHGIPSVTELVYGQVPEGYHETVPSRTLVHGERYCIVAIGEEPFDVARVYYSF